MRWAQAAIDAEPDNPRAYLELVFVQSNADDPESCEPTADRIIELLPEPIDWPFLAARDEFLMANLGYCLQQLGRNELALRAYQAADYQGMDEGWLHSNLSYVAQFRLDRPDLAAVHAARAIELEGRSLYDADTLTDRQ